MPVPFNNVVKRFAHAVAKNIKKHPSSKIKKSPGPEPTVVRPEPTVVLPEPTGVRPEPRGVHSFIQVINAKRRATSRVIKNNKGKFTHSYPVCTPVYTPTVRF